ncbi:MAG TPA: hypothetical protein VK543_02495 [Puia sp.]|nr:hypothetical protein [Puia sp.]
MELKVECYTDYDFCKATQTLNLLLIQKRPKSFDPQWIEHHDRYLYKYLSRHVKTETGEVDWDAVTTALERRFQKRWYWYRKRKAITSMPYENKEELDLVLASFESKLYTALVPQNEKDEKIQDKIFIRLVRASQKGNILAQKKVIEWLTIIVNEWIESSSSLVKWKGYPGDVIERIQGCIRCYRYTGTFIGYVYKTFQYSARGLRSTCSLNDRVGKGTKTRIDYIIQE